MAVKNHLPGRLRNCSLSTSNALYPLFEAVVNSIHAIEERGAIGSGRITVTIHRRPGQPDLTGAGPISLGHIRAFTIQDSGTGFTDKNFESFETVDSVAKSAIGGKGVGRLLWLLAFRRARVRSVYLDAGGNRVARSFEFEPTVEGIVKHVVEAAGETDQVGTTVELLDMLPAYADKAPRQASVIGRRIVDHCLGYFVLGTCPRIVVVDSDTAEQTDLMDLFSSEVLGGQTSQSLTLRGETFTLRHVKIAADSTVQHRVHYCAHHRTVASEPLLGKIPNLTPALIEDDERPFVYYGYVSSPFLDARVNSDRTRFSIPESASPLDSEPAWDDIVDGCLTEARAYLEPFTGPIRAQKNERVAEYVRTKAPRYRHVLKHRAAVLDQIPANATNDKIDLELYRAQQSYQHELQHRYQVLLEENDPKAIAEDQYETAFRAFIEEWNEAGMAALAEHVMLRSATLRFLDSRRGIQPDGRYLLEEAIHQVIFPMKQTSDDLPAEKMNLWIIDEGLAYHQYVASDFRFADLEVIDHESQDRPDIIIFNQRAAFSASASAFQSVVLVEFKKPGRNNFNDEDNPFTQMYRYVRTIRDGKAKDRRGAYMNVGASMPFYGYVIAELSPTLRQQIENYSFKPTPDGAGYFGYNENLGIWVEVMSFDKLIDDARRRNAVFFEKLGVNPKG